jgi:hypothetical protein
LDILEFQPELEYMQGKSAWPLITGKIEKIHDYVTMGFFDTEDRCIRDEEWSYIRRPSGQKSELYNLIDDPKETNNLFDKHAQKVNDMEALIARVFDCRLQKESWIQLSYNIPGICEEKFRPKRIWKK